MQNLKKNAVYTTLNHNRILKLILSKYFIFSTSTGIDSFEQGVVGGDVTMMCPTQTANDAMIGEWSWYRYDSTIKKKIAVMKVNNSVPVGPSVTSPYQPIVTTFLDGTLTIGGLQLNDSGVYECQLDTGNHTERRYIRLAISGKFLTRMINSMI